MLKIVVNQCPKSIRESIGSDLFINDSNIYDFINGDAIFYGQSFYYKGFEGIANAIIDKENKFPQDILLVHSFNPLFLNYFSNEDAIKYFEYYDPHKKVFKKVFELPHIFKLLDSMGPGEAVCETNFDYL